MTDFPQLKMRAVVNFPAQSYGRVGITVTKTAGAFYTDLDYSKFMPPIITLPGDTTNFYSLVWNSSTNVYELCPLALSGGTSPSNVNPLMDGVAAPGASAFFSRGDHVHPTDISRAPVNNPNLTGDPQAPTPAAGDNDQSIATTAFVTGAVATANGIYRVITAAGSVTIAPNDRVVAINKTVGAATPVTLPLAATKNGPVIISDFKRDAGTNNITLTGTGGELIQGLATLTLAANGASAQLFPLPGVGYSL